MPLPTEISVPSSLLLLDPDDDAQCQNWLDLREQYRYDDLVPQIIADVRDEQRWYPGELLRVAARDGSFAASVVTIRDEQGTGGTYCTLFANPVPGLSDLVTFTCDRARAGGVSYVHFGVQEGHPLREILRDEYGFYEHERWRNFELDLEGGSPSAFLTSDEHASTGVVTLGERPDLLDEVFRVDRDGVADTPGDFPRPDMTAERWLQEIDESDVMDRSLVFIVLDAPGGNRVRAMFQVARVAGDSPVASVEFLAVDREYRGSGFAKLVKRAAATRAREYGLSSFRTMNHEGNESACRLNESLGWVETPARISMRIDVS